MTTSTPTSMVAVMNPKPKIGFSIDSIVGNLDKQYHHQNNAKMMFHSGVACKLFNANNKLKTNKLFQITQNNVNANDNNLKKQNTEITSFRQLLNTKSAEHDEISDSSSRMLKNAENESKIPKCFINGNNLSRTSSPVSAALKPIAVPSIPANLVRPYPIVPMTKQLPASYLNGAPELVANNHHHHSPHHFLAAQFQMAAALAHTNQGYASTTVLPSHVSPPNMSRDGYSMYPWFLNRHSRFFSHRFPGSK